MQNLIYAITFPNFVVTEWGSEAVWREDGGKVISRSTHRVEQTGSANALWWYYGPHDERTKSSVESINRLHAHWAKKFPGNFSHQSDYIYVCAFTAVTIHRLMLQMGLPGISPKEQVAAHLFWREMSKLFVAEGGVPIEGFPEDFDGMIRYCEAFEEAPKSKPERGNLITNAIHEQFVFRFFPPDIQWLGHQLIRSLSLPTTLETMQIDPPFPMAKEILPKLLGLVFWHQEVFGDDPEQSYIEARDQLPPEEKARIRAEIGKLDKAFPDHFAALFKGDPKFVGCPFHAALADPAVREGTEVSPEMHAIEVTAGVIEE